MYKVNINLLSESKEIEMFGIPINIYDLSQIIIDETGNITEYIAKDDVFEPEE